MNFKELADLLKSWDPQGFSREDYLASRRTIIEFGKTCILSTRDVRVDFCVDLEEKITRASIYGQREFLNYPIINDFALKYVEGLNLSLHDNGLRMGRDNHGKPRGLRGMIFICEPQAIDSSESFDNAIARVMGAQILIYTRQFEYENGFLKDPEDDMRGFVLEVEKHRQEKEIEKDRKRLERATRMKPARVQYAPTIRARARKFDYSLPPSLDSQSKYGPDVLAQTCNLLNSGENLRQVAAKLGIPLGSMGALVKRLKRAPLKE